MRLFVFNPWHEEALAAGTAFYTPTRAAQRTEHDAFGVMRRWMRAGDLLLGTDVRHPHWDDVEEIIPWGWDLLLHRKLSRLGAPERLLPSFRKLETVRQLSSRNTAVHLLPLLRADVEGTVGESRWCETGAEAMEAVRLWGGAMMKAPWSCAGRGVFHVPYPPTVRDHSRMLKVLRRQGALEAQRYYPGGRDFAMEFLYRDGQAHYAGLSLFTTTPQGTYDENFEGTEEELRARLLDERTEYIYNNVCLALQKHLPTLLGTDYAGPLGVDMLLVDGCIHPCIEINLRFTMGMNSHLLEC
ncbi:MAG: hypothetical protein IJ659_05695 [Alloprevotella sp.]|nr:hypothetical protein [Alloprevotella sp.]